jgi:hypothetical protein
MLHFEDEGTAVRLKRRYVFSSRHVVKLPEGLSREACKIGKEPIIIIIIIIIDIYKLSLYTKRRNINY